MKEAVIVGALRTPIGKFLGALKPLSAVDLGAFVVKALVEKYRLPVAQVEEIIMGNVVSAGLGQNPARQAGLRGGLKPEVAALTINKVCGSGLKAVGLAAQAVQLEEAQLVIAGGMESMSNAPYLLPAARNGLRLGHGKVVDAMIQDGLWDAFEDFHMGNTGEIVAEKHRITRQQQDEFALNSHRKAVAAAKEGRFRSQLAPIPVPQKKGEPVLFAVDESPREDASLETLRALKPIFKKDGTVTAGNAPGTNDGAAAVVVASPGRAKELGLAPMAVVAGQAVTGVEPRDVMMAPVSAVEKLLKKTGWARDAVDLYEINEAFSVQAIAVIEQLRLNPEKVNVNGGAVALGHPIGCSGARILVTLLHEMARRDARKGIAALCLGGGNAVAMAVER
ncbi:MAG: acetyl-CoA C-acetyltransferase [Acidobacteria bacterium]|nr:acetyl-CoA C-acetyltransferase [Acidobacteriota bacterium]MCI0621982.1 acetyl-CoA C-acetyltransferase [Acidobacteriota bacterium]MCI0721534.1 acetyl-CoA C-acetyltransferase [Acidobacteriota bacterium]